MEKLNSNVSPRQLALYFALIAPVAKLFLLPASYTFDAGKDAYLCVLLQGFFDIFTLAGLLYTIKKDGRSLFEIMSSAFGNIATRIIFALYCLFFMIKLFLPIIESLLLSYRVLYESTPSFIFFVPIFIVLFYSAITGLNGIMRTVEFLTPAMIIAYFGLILLSCTSVNPKEALPLFEYGLNPAKTALSGHLGWFGDFVVILLMLNNIKIKKGEGGRIVLGYGIGIVITAVLFFINTGIFGYSAPRQIYMITKISKYSIAFSNLGRIDFLFIMIMFVAMILICSLFSALSTKCLTTVTGLKPWINSLIISSALLIVSALFLLDAADIISGYKKILPVFVVFQYFIPSVIPIISFFTKRREVAA